MTEPVKQLTWSPGISPSESARLTFEAYKAMLIEAGWTVASSAEPDLFVRGNEKAEISMDEATCRHSVVWNPDPAAWVTFRYGPQVTKRGPKYQRNKCGKRKSGISGVGTPPKPIRPHRAPENPKRSHSDGVLWSSCTDWSRPSDDQNPRDFHRDQVQAFL